MRELDPQPALSFVMNFLVCLVTQNVLFSITYQAIKTNSDERNRKSES